MMIAAEGCQKRCQESLEALGTGDVTVSRCAIALHGFVTGSHSLVEGVLSYRQ